MRHLFLLGFAVSVLTLSRAAVPAPLAAALKRASDDSDRWAYTESEVMRDKDGKIELAETTVRFDPSKPFEEQYTPLMVHGRKPTERDRAKYRKQGVERGKKLQHDAEKEPPAKPDEETGQIEFDNKNAFMDLASAKVIAEQGASLTYDIPLRVAPGRTTKLPIDKLRIQMRVNRERQMLENIHVQLLAPIRLKLVAKISAGDLNLDFVEADPKYPSVLSAVRMDFSASLLLVMRKTGTFEQHRTDYQRVKPYFEKFGVKIGPLKALPF